MSNFYNYLGIRVNRGNKLILEILKFFKESFQTQKFKFRLFRDLFKIISFLKRFRRDEITPRGFQNCKTEPGSTNKIFQRCPWPRAGGIKDLIDLIRSMTNSDTDHKFVHKDSRNLPAFDRGENWEIKTKIIHTKIIIKLSFVVSLAAVLSAIIYLILPKQNVEW
jgi:hypothetical protein